jgi:hypothetical protein
VATLTGADLSGFPPPTSSSNRSKSSQKYSTPISDREDEKPVTIEEILRHLEERMISLFKKDQNGIRPCMGADNPFAKDPHFSDWILFSEFFHADTGKGLGASHQTGWSGLVANFIDELKRSS